MNPIRKLMKATDSEDDWRGIVAYLMLIFGGGTVLGLAIAAALTWPWIGIPVTIYLLYKLYKVVTQEEKETANDQH